MFKKLGIAFALLQTISLCASTDVWLHIEHKGQSLVNDNFVLEDNQVIPLEQDSLIVELKQETINDVRTLTVNMQTKDADGKLTTIAKPMLLLREGSASTLTMKNHHVDHDGKSVPESVLSVFASFQ